jgi:hypothetical protein
VECSAPFRNEEIDTVCLSPFASNSNEASTCGGNIPA